MQDSKITTFYDTFVDHQVSLGINDRHIGILSRLKSHGLKKTDRVLEVGCGIGTVTKLLAKYLSNGSVVAVDISPKSIEIATKTLLNFKNVECQVVDLTEDDFEGEFDAVVLPDVLEHIPIEKHSKLFEKLASLLTSNGVIFINIPNPYSLEWAHIHKKEELQILDQPLYTVDLLPHLYEHGFHLHFLETYSISMRDGDYQFLVVKKNGFQVFEAKAEKSFFKLAKNKILRMINS